MQKRAKSSLYYKIYKNIKNDIVTKKLKAGEKLPSENEMLSEYKVSRYTIRQAIQKLKDKGYIHSYQGRGNFVANIKIPYNMTKKSNYSSQILDIGFEPSSKILNTEIIPADEDVANELKIKEGEDVLMLKILKYVDNTPFAIYTSFFNAKRFANLKDYINDDTSLYRILEEKFNVISTKQDCFFEAMLPTNEEADLLMIPLGFPLLVSNVPSIDQDGNPVECGFAKFRSDLAKIKIKLN